MVGLWGPQGDSETLWSQSWHADGVLDSRSGTVKNSWGMQAPDQVMPLCVAWWTGEASLKESGFALHLQRLGWQNARCPSTSGSGPDPVTPENLEPLEKCSPWH